MSDSVDKIVILPEEAAAAAPYGSAPARLPISEEPPARPNLESPALATLRSPYLLGWILGGLGTAIVTTLLFIAAVGSVAAPETSAQESIMAVFQADEELARRRDELTAGATAAQTAEVIGRYCEALAAVDMSRCPAEFRVAYRHHLGAWREVQAAAQQLPNGFVEGLLMGAVNGVLRGEADGGQGRLTGALQRASERVRDTWIEVERIGAHHGAAR